MLRPHLKPVHWIGDSRERLHDFPKAVKDAIGYALYVAQRGDKPEDAKPLKGFHGSGVVEITANYDGETYRAVYTVKFADMVFVLHAFQKKSKHGIATPKRDLELIRPRLKKAQEMYHRLRMEDVN